MSDRQQQYWYFSGVGLTKELAAMDTNLGMDLKEIADNLEYKNGVWYARTKSSISYPDEGNEICFKLEDYSFWFRHRNNCIIEIARHFQPKGVLLDVGGGNGYVSYGLEKAGFQTILLEPGEKGIFNARKRNLKNLVCSTFEEAEFKENSIPAVGVFDVVEHMKDDAGFLRQIHRYMQTDGIMFLTVPAYQFLWSSEDDKAGHYRRYTVKDISEKLNRAGFKIEFSTYIFSILPIPIFLFRSLPSKLGYRKTTIDYNRYRTEHEDKKGINDKIWNWEVKRIKNKKKIPFGGSCLIVARKT